MLCGSCCGGIGQLCEAVFNMIVQALMAMRIAEDCHTFVICWGFLCLYI